MGYVVDYVMKMQDLMSGPLGRIAKSYTKVSDNAQRASDTSSRFAKLAAGAFNINNIVGLVSNAVGAMKQYTDANRAQVEAEARLAQVMRNTMDASDDEIQSIKDLASAQQQLGIVGDEIQLAGAQELGTYLEKSDTLKQLIPVMNDMVAQQYGFNATQEAAVNIATMMGKVMDGQVGALSRYGYKFSEAQEQILKFGTEEQRAATLAEVISESVGGMNEALAQTPEGRVKQLSNTLGDMKEQVGAQFTKLGAALVPVAEKLVQPLSAGLSKASDLVDWLIAKFGSIRPQILQISRPVLSLTRTVRNSLGGLSGYLIPVAELFEQRIYPLAVQLWTGITGIVGDLTKFVSSSELLKDIFAFIGHIIGGIGDMLRGLVSAVQWLWNNVIMPLLNGIEKAYRWIKGSDMQGGSNKPIDTVTGAAIPVAMENAGTNSKLQQIADNTKRNADVGTTTAKAVASSGPKVVNINVQKFFDNIQFTTNNLQESTARIEETVLEVLSRVLVQGAATV